MKVYEVLDDSLSVLKHDLKKNKGRSVKAIVRGEKCRTNGVPTKNNDLPKETVVMA